MGAKKKIGVKYCGGCNPSYERVEMVERIKFRFNDQFLFLRHDDPELEVMVLMSGCQRACACRDWNPKAIPHYSVTGENDFENLIGWLTSPSGKGDS